MQWGLPFNQYQSPFIGLFPSQIDTAYLDVADIENIGYGKGVKLTQELADTTDPESYITKAVLTEDVSQVNAFILGRTDNVPLPVGQGVVRIDVTCYGTVTGDFTEGRALTIEQCWEDQASCPIVITRNKFKAKAPNQYVLQGAKFIAGA